MLACSPRFVPTTVCGAHGVLHDLLSFNNGLMIGQFDGAHVPVGGMLR